MHVCKTRKCMSANNKDTDKYTEWNRLGAKVNVGTGKLGEGVLVLRLRLLLHGHALRRLDLRHEIPARLVETFHLALELGLELIKLRVQPRHALLRRIIFALRHLKPAHTATLSAPAHGNSPPFVRKWGGKSSCIAQCRSGSCCLPKRVGAHASLHAHENVPPHPRPRPLHSCLSTPPMPFSFGCKHPRATRSAQIASGDHLSHSLSFSLRGSNLRPSKCTAHRALSCRQTPSFQPATQSRTMRTGACRSEAQDSRQNAEATRAKGPRRLVRVHPRAPTLHWECHEAQSSRPFASVVVCRVCAQILSSPAQNSCSPTSRCTRAQNGSATRKRKGGRIYLRAFSAALSIMTGPAGAVYRKHAKATRATPTMAATA